jgi:hypothetical protein
MGGGGVECRVSERAKWRQPSGGARGRAAAACAAGCSGTGKALRQAQRLRMRANTGRSSARALSHPSPA